MIKISRRDFLKGTAATGLAAAISSLGFGALSLAKENGEDVLVVDDSLSASQSIEETAGKFQSGSCNGVDYCYYAPDSDEALPLVLVLHGEDGKGENGKQLTANAGPTFFAADNQQQIYPCYVLAPQCPDENWDSEETASKVRELLDEFCSGNNVDLDRIYVNGMSMGGAGVWNMLLTYPTVFAAGMPICGYVPARFYETAGAFDGLIHLPIYCYHCADDDVIAEEETSKAVAACQEAGSQCCYYEVWSAGSIIPAHNAWEKVYSIGKPYRWLFQQSLTRTNHGEKDPFLLYTHKQLSGRVTEVLDHDVDKLYVINEGSEVLLIDSAMGGYGAADLYQYLIDNSLVDPEAPIDVLLTHKHIDHILGIQSLYNHGMLRRVYIHENEYEVMKETFAGWGMEEDKYELATYKEGDLIQTGDETLEVLLVPGHTEGSSVFYYNDYCFIGDAIGSGDLWLNDTFENYLPSVEHFLSDMALRQDGIELLSGHAENLHPFTIQYLKDMTLLVRYMMAGKITPGRYFRREGNYATYASANIYYNSEIFNS